MDTSTASPSGNEAFRLEPQTQVAFSGGRTSGYMLSKIAAVYGGHLPDDVKVIFTNTGKERPETLDFVQECLLRFAVPIIWLEYTPEKPYWKQVTHLTASREGEPFEQLITRQKAIPNPRRRFCTRFLKIRPAYAYCRDVLGWASWDTAVGIRYDEPKRYLGKPDYNLLFPRTVQVRPLVKARVTEATIREYWLTSPFDLKLPYGRSNCDLCFLKGLKPTIEVIREEPHRTNWWIAQEERIGHEFRNSKRSVRSLVSLSVLPTTPTGDETYDCACTD